MLTSVCAFGQSVPADDVVIHPTATLNLYAGMAPGSESAQQKEKDEVLLGNHIVRNVVAPTLTVYLPSPSIATGTGVIIAPGGAFMMLSIDSEGHDVARWLAARGVSAFVLKYRLAETPDDDGQFQQKLMEALRPAMMPAAPGANRSINLDFDTIAKPGIADGLQAIRIVRQHAAEWGVDPAKVGFLGFSAGAMVATGVLLQSDAAGRPNFDAPIYGAPFGVLPAIPANLPPIFLAFAADDPIAPAPVMQFYRALIAAGDKPELHVFSAGNHGFGMRHQGTSSDHWIDEFYFWLQSLKLARP
jgi:acetyl esterase/lipase